MTPNTFFATAQGRFAVGGWKMRNTTVDLESQL